MGDSERPKSFNDELGSQIVNIFVGSKREKFCVHHRLLCTKSPYFERSLRSSKEVHAGIYRYELNANIDAFALVIEWLYKGTIKRPSANLSVRSAHIFITSQIELYIIAELLEIKALADAVVTSVGKCYSFHGFFPSKSEIMQVYTETRPGSPLRDYMTKSFYFMLLKRADTASSDVSSLTTAELWEIAKTHDELGKEIFRDIRKGEPAPRNPHQMLVCDYHHHDCSAYCPSRGQSFTGAVEQNPGLQQCKRELSGTAQDQRQQQLAKQGLHSSAQPKFPPAQACLQAGKQHSLSESRHEKNTSHDAVVSRVTPSPDRLGFGIHPESQLPSNKHARSSADTMEDSTPRDKRIRGAVSVPR